MANVRTVTFKTDDENFERQFLCSAGDEHFKNLTLSYNERHKKNLDSCISVGVIANLGSVDVALGQNAIDVKIAPWNCKDDAYAYCDALMRTVECFCKGCEFCSAKTR